MKVRMYMDVPRCTPMGALRPAGMFKLVPNTHLFASSKKPNAQCGSQNTRVFFDVELSDEIFTEGVMVQAGDVQSFATETPE